MRRNNVCLNLLATIAICLLGMSCSDDSNPINPEPSLSPPVAGFIADTTAGDPGLIVQFTDKSTGSPTSWEWDFGDGASSIEQNPSHTYGSAGQFTVKLTVHGSGGETSETKTDYISTDVCFDPPTPFADFALPTGPFGNTFSTYIVGQSVSITDESYSGRIDVAISSYEWDFGDGTRSTAKNPSHIYQACGSYVVTLTVTNECGQTDTRIKNGFIHITSVVSVSSVRPADFKAFPTKIEGDCEFDGNGPEVSVRITLERRNGNQELWAKIYMQVRETTADWSTARSPHGNWQVKLYSAPGDYEIGELQDDVSYSYTDTDHDYHDYEFWGGTIRTKGDTPGDDICSKLDDDTHISIEWQPFEVRMRKCN